MLLANVIDQVAMECDLQECTIAQYRLAVSRFSAWLGRAASKDDLTTDYLNGFLCALQKRLSGTTVRNYRVAITRVWNYLSTNHGHPSYEVRRLRRPKQERKPVYSWWPDEVSLLLKATNNLSGKLKTGIWEADFLRAWILVEYDTGIRPVDMRLLTWEDVDLERGTVAIVQHKTLQPHSALLRDSTRIALEKISYPFRERVFYLTKGGMRRLELSLFREAAALGFKRRHGQGLGTLRKTHATSIYITDGETAAAESLGHVGGVRTVRTSYIDHRAVKRGRLPPPAA